MYIADILGIPSNATNYLRDLNVSIPYRLSSAIRGAYHTIKDGTSFSSSYNSALSNPSWFEKRITINPLVNTNRNFSDKELEIIYNMAGNKGYINNADIKRVSPSNKYGSSGSLGSYFDPFKVVQTAVGQMSHDPNGYLQDLFDVNTKSRVAKSDNNMYINMMLQHPGINYQTIRATMPYINSIDIMPDEYKIQTKINKR